MKFTSSSFMRALVAAMVSASIGCASSQPTEFSKDTQDEWDFSNDPERFDKNYIYDWDELGKDELAEGSAALTPWPGTYWPSVEDGYNARWRGANRLSAMELYDLAYSGWQPAGGLNAFMKLRPFTAPGVAYDSAYYAKLGPAATWAHTHGGAYKARTKTAANGTPLWDTESEIPFADWGGLQTWFGHCYAWASASFSVVEPKHPVTVNGVTFQVSDIKALIAATYDTAQKRNIGGRCLTNDIEHDEFGRITSRSCRDTNAGTFHVVLLNRMGIDGESFVFDVTPTAEVWNQPARDYKIHKQNEVSLPKALALVGRTDVEEYPYNENAKRFVEVDMTFRYVVEGFPDAAPYGSKVEALTHHKNYQYLLELDAEGEILGGEWLGDSERPDYMWFPYGPRDVKTGWDGDTIISLENVQELIELSAR